MVRLEQAQRRPTGITDAHCQPPVDGFFGKIALLTDAAVQHIEIVLFAEDERAGNAARTWNAKIETLAYLFGVFDLCQFQIEKARAVVSFELAPIGAQPEPGGVHFEINGELLVIYNALGLLRQRLNPRRISLRIS